METDLERLLDSLPGLVWTAFPDGRAEYLSKGWLDYTGLTLGEARGEGWLAAVHPEDRQQLLNAWVDIQATDRLGETEARLRRFDGTYRWFLFRANPMPDASGEIQRWCGVNMDIQDRVRAQAAEAELSRANRQLTDAQRLSRTGSFTWDLYADEHVWSEEIYRIFEFPLSSKVTMDKLQAAIHPEDKAAVEGLLRGVVDSPAFDLVFRIVTPAGAVKHAHVVGQRMEEIADRPVFLGALRDITESQVAQEQRRVNEASLTRANRYLKGAQRLSKTGSWTWDPERDELDWSDEIYRIFGIDPAEKPKPAMVFAAVHPGDLAAFEELHNDAIASGEGWEHVFRIVAPDGAVKWLHAKTERNTEIEDRPVFIGSTQDITESVNAEEALSNAVAELARVSRLMTASALTASIAHEVNQPLAGIITNASTCLRALAGEPPNLQTARTTVQRIIRDGNRAADLVQRLRDLFVRKPPHMEPINLNDVTREVLALSYRELRQRGVVLHTHFAADLPPINGDRVQLQQVIMNLVVNAADAMDELVDRQRSLVVRTSEGAGQVLLSVQDAGIGLDDTQTETVFDAFHTTKSSGMGIGLFVSRSIVESHDGRVWATPNEKFGVTFTVSLPQLL